MSEIPQASYKDHPDFTALMMEYLLFRLGGEQHFTRKEMADIQAEFHGVRIIETFDVDQDGEKTSGIRVVLLTKEALREHFKTSEAQKTEEGILQDGGSSKDRV